MEGLCLEDGNLIKHIRNIFRLKKEQNYTAAKDTRNHCRQEKEIKVIKDRILRNVKNIFERKKKENH